MTFEGPRLALSHIPKMQPHIGSHIFISFSQDFSLRMRLFAVVDAFKCDSCTRNPQLHALYCTPRLAPEDAFGSSAKAVQLTSRHSTCRIELYHFLQYKGFLHLVARAAFGVWGLGASSCLTHEAQSLHRNTYTAFLTAVSFFRCAGR